MSKKIISSLLALSMMVSILSGTVSAENNTIKNDDSSLLVEDSDFNVYEEDNILLPYVEEANIFSTTEPEAKEEGNNYVEDNIQPKDNNELILTETDKEKISDELPANRPTPVPDNYIRKTVAERNVRIRVTRDGIPESNADVTINNILLKTDDNGCAIFADIPVSEDKYLVSVRAENDERIECRISVRGTIFVQSDTDEIPTKDVNLTFRSASENSINIEANRTKRSQQANTVNSDQDWEYSGYIPAVIGENVAAVAGTKIYIIKKNHPETMYVYNTISNSCSSADSFPSNVVNIVDIAGDSNYIYALSNDYIYRYSISENSWTSFESNEDIEDGKIFVYNDELYYINCLHIIKYNFNTEEWNNIYDISSAGIHREVNYAYAENNVIYFCVGYSKSLYKYNLITHQLTATEECYGINDDHSYIACGANRKMYYVGGEQFTIEYNYDDGYYDSEGEWVEEETIEYIYEPIPLCFRYNYDNDSLNEINDLPFESSTHSAIYCRGKLYAIAGNQFSGLTGSTVYSYDIGDFNMSIPTVEQNHVAVGKDHVLVVNDDNTVSSKGKNAYGQLGNGSTEDSDALQVIAGLNNVSAVYAGDGFSAALKNDGTVWMWGKNDVYQTAMQDISGTYTPHQVNVSNIVKMALGNNHVLALTSSGVVRVWGGNEHCELGHLEFDNSPWEPNSIGTFWEGDIVDIAAGSEFSMALDKHGKAYVWGDNSFGQLMVSPTELSNKEYQTLVPINNICSIQTGSNHVLIMDVLGNVYSWGDNQYGQCGLGHNKQYAIEPTIITSSTSQAIKVDKILAGHNVSFIWGEDGNICSFGQNEYGQLGRQYNQYAVKEISDENVFHEIAIGPYMVYAVDNNLQLRRWGLMTSEIHTDNYSPRNINYSYRIKQIDSYRNQTLAIDNLGQVLVWGEGYVGNGSDSELVREYPTKVEGIDNPKQVSRGKNHNLVLDENGDVWGWGSNSNYPMGNLNSKVRIPTKINGISEVQQIAAGTEFSIFLKKDGTLWGVGKNDRGQLGQGNTNNTINPVQITLKHDFKKVSVSESYATAIAEDGLYVWGGNSYYQLGIEDRNDRLVPTKLEISLEDGEYFKDISAGMDFCLALTNKGNVYGWGNNGSGSIGQHGQYKTPAKIEALSDIYRISAGKKSALAIKANGTVYGWGYGYDGQLGYEAGSEFEPKEVTALSDKGIVDVSCGYNFSTALSNDGTVYSFGDNAYKQLGFFTYISKPCMDQIKTVTEVLENADMNNNVEHSFTLEAGEVHILEFDINSDGMYEINTYSDSPNLVVEAYRDGDYNTPYKQTTTKGKLIVGAEKGSKIQLRFYDTSNNGVDVATNIEKTGEIITDNKTVYIVMYDSEMDRYYDSQKMHYVYDKEFFEQLLYLYENQNIALVLSDREADFDLVYGVNTTYNTRVKYVVPEQDKLAHYSKIVEITTKRYIDILNIIKSVVDTNHGIKFPEIYIGTPYYECEDILDSTDPDIIVNAVNQYANMSMEIFDNVIKTSTENHYEQYIKGIYYGRENPYDYETNVATVNDGQIYNIETMMMKETCSRIHKIGKKVVWFPFTSGQDLQMKKIAPIINQGKDNFGNDLIDIAIIQPNFFYYELNTTAGDDGYITNTKKILESVTKKKVTYIDGYDDSTSTKTTNTKILFELECDMGLVSGRNQDNRLQNPMDKIYKLAFTLSTFKHLIFDKQTSYGLYVGGPNEMGFTWEMLSDKNTNYHSNRNFRTLLQEEHPFFKYKSELEKTVEFQQQSSPQYNGKLLYDIIYFLIHGNDVTPSMGMTQELRNFFGEANINMMEE